MPWPKEPWIGCGYSCPGPGQVTNVAKRLAHPFKDRLIFAGEHTSPCFFGFMEGALESGLLAMAYIPSLSGQSGYYEKVVTALNAAADAGWNPGPT